MALPTVTAEVRDSVVARIKKEGSEYVKAVLIELAKDQPAFVEAFSDMAAKDEEAAMTIHISFATAYALLKAQSDTNDFERLFSRTKNPVTSIE